MGETSDHTATTIVPPTVLHNENKQVSEVVELAKVYKPNAHQFFFVILLLNLQNKRVHPQVHQHPRAPQVLHSIAHLVNYDKVSTQHYIFLAAITTGHESCNFNEAMKDAGCRKVMQKEINAFEAD